MTSSDVTLRPYTPADLETWRSLVAEPTIAPQFEGFLGSGGLESKLADPHLEMDTIFLAFAEDTPVGFGLSFILEGGGEPWAMIRYGVVPEWRRKGIGTRLVRTVMDAVDRHGRLEKLTGAWLPADGVEEFVASLGFVHERWFWMMERERGAASPEPVWPSGVTLRLFDGSDEMLRDWNDAYNGSFIDHFRYVPGTLEEARSLAAAPHFRPEGLVVAYRNGEVAGFCRCEVHPSRGEIGTVGTVRSARGIGLGRALLRWGVAWLERNTGTPVTLLVDGQNENAMSLYRSEGFGTSRTRRLWKCAP